MGGVGTSLFPLDVVSEAVLLADEFASVSMCDGEPISLKGLNLVSVMIAGLVDIFR